jgi:hypothetical protein
MQTLSPVIPPADAMYNVVAIDTLRPVLVCAAQDFADLGEPRFANYG